MKPRRTPNQLLAVLLGTGLGFLVFTAHASNFRTQTIALHKGWNSVFIQVTPAEPNPAIIFSNTPVSIAASYLALDKPVQFIQNPGGIQWNKEGWGVWYAGNRPDAFLSTLHAIQGNQAYLIYSQQDFSWSVTGLVTLEVMRWKSDSFNLVGFTLDETGPPTFDQFFAASSAHKPYRIFRMDGDHWTSINDGIQSKMRSGEAYWVYCSGSSDFQGPLRARIPAGQRLEFGTGSEAWVNVKNQSSDPMTIEVETVATDLPLPLSYIVRGVTEASIDNFSVPLPSVYRLPVLEPGENYSFWLNLNREKMTTGYQSQLLKISSDSGAQVWIPLLGSRPVAAVTR